MATPHNAASAGEIAETVLLPGDPLRAQYIADKYLKESQKVTDTRNMFGFTGFYTSEDGKTARITVMGSGMGGSSCGLYSYELFKMYDVKQIIRIGTAGGLQSFLKPGDLVFAMTASTDSNWARQYALPGTFSPTADFGLLSKAVAAADAHGYRHFEGGVFSSDYFSDYNALNEVTGKKCWEPWARMGSLVQDMETYALYSNAAWLRKKALSILTHTDSCVFEDEHLPYENRIPALEAMFITALETAAATSSGK